MGIKIEITLDEAQVKEAITMYLREKGFSTVKVDYKLTTRVRIWSRRV